MRFDLTEDQRMARDVARALLATEYPIVRAREALESAGNFEADLWRRIAGMGWLSPLVPKELGGAAISAEPTVDVSILSAEFGRTLAPGPFLETQVILDALCSSANIELCDQLVPGLVEGHLLPGWCVDHSSWLRGRAGALLAVPTPAGGADLSGRLVAAIPPGCDVLLVSTPMLSCVIPTGSAGVSVQPLPGLDPSNRHAVVTFDNLEAPPGAMLGLGGGALERSSRLAWVLQVAELTGIVDSVFALTMEWLGDRYSFGRPLASYQALKHRCADMKTWLEATHAIGDAAASALAADGNDAGILARAAKAYGSTQAIELIQDCVQLHGGVGVTWDHDLHLYLRRATVIWQSYGTPTELYGDIAASELAELAA